MKKFKVNVKVYRNITFEVENKNRKAAVKMVQDVIENSNLLAYVNGERTKILYRVKEEARNNE